MDEHLRLFTNLHNAASFYEMGGQDSSGDLEGEAKQMDGGRSFNLDIEWQVL